MSTAAPPAEREAPASPSGARGRDRGRGGPWASSAFGIVTALGVVIGMAEYAATKGAYRPWTWIKVGFLYLLSFCGVGVHVDSSGPSTFGVGASHLLFRFPMMVCTALVLWLLFRAGRASGERILGSVGAASACVVAAAAAFAIPAFLVSLPATLRFPNVAGTVSPVRWQAAVLPFGLALCAAAAGAVRGARVAAGADLRRGGGWVAVLEGGWRMFLLALGLAFVAFLVLAAVKPDGSAAYARFVRDSGRVGAVTVAHHALLLPDQSVWVLAPAMGGSTQVVVSSAEPFPSTITLSGIDEGALGLFLDPTGELSGGGRIALGGGFYLFLLVPLAATSLERAPGGGHRSPCRRTPHPGRGLGGRVRRLDGRGGGVLGVGPAAAAARPVRGPARVGPRDHALDGAAGARLGGGGRRARGALDRWPAAPPGARSGAGRARPRLTAQSHLGVVGLDVRVAAPRGGPAGIVARELLRRARRVPAGPRCRRTSGRSPAGSAVPECVYCTTSLSVGSTGRCRRRRRGRRGRRGPAARPPAGRRCGSAPAPRTGSRPAASRRRCAGSAPRGRVGVCRSQMPKKSAP